MQTWVDQAATRLALIVVTVQLSLILSGSWRKCAFHHVGRLSTFSEAQAYCQSYGGRLIEPNTLGQFNLTHELIKHRRDSSKFTYLGFTDFDLHGHFTAISSGEELRVNLWDNGS